MKDVRIEKFRKVKLLIRDRIEEQGFNKGLASYTRELGGDALDASSLIFPLVGYCDAGSPGMISTCRLIKEQLSHTGLLYRYQPETDGVTGGEGAFGICNFWLVENLAKSGALPEAVRHFKLMLNHASPTGLLSEEIDPRSHDLLGNYPQSFTHIGLINAAVTINQAIREEAGHEY